MTVPEQDPDRQIGELPKGGPEKVGYVTGLCGGLIMLPVVALLFGMLLGLFGGAATLTYRWVLR